jgi:hypothetical protein
MIGRRRVLSGMAAAAFGAAFLVPATEAIAQRGNSAANRLHAGHGFANRYSWSHQSAGRRIGHALDYSNDLRHYATVAPAPAAPTQPQPGPAAVPTTRYPVVVTEEIGRNIAAARQDLAAAKKSPAVADDAEAKKSFEAIERHLAAAAEQHEQMVGCCAGEECDTETMAQCCDDAAKHLEAAKAENEKLMKRLYPDHGKAAGRPAASGAKPAGQP